MIVKIALGLTRHVLGESESGFNIIIIIIVLSSNVRDNYYPVQCNK